ncbi:hypothetical protein BpHYR1_007013 [Brachionus plicatilis]|uniref:Uncharacterized protein n=1 Tax=Brachionus plicatilis TaxID=10195 RepID=A0A3M7SEQ6_BRAPC|nr:hypothetical protein BpHYR1_007013 [Brachionus plicatilis]
MCSDPLVDDCLRYIWIRLRADGMVLDACQLDWLLTLKPLKYPSWNIIDVMSRKLDAFNALILMLESQMY